MTSIPLNRTQGSNQSISWVSCYAGTLPLHGSVPVLRLSTWPGPYRVIFCDNYSDLNLAVEPTLGRKLVYYIQLSRPGPPGVYSNLLEQITFCSMSVCI